MNQLKKNLTNKLRDAKKVALLGVGSELRGDDVAGLVVAEQLQKFPPKSKQKRRLKVFIGATAPENLTGEIKEFKPTHLVIVDAADLNLKPGQVRMFTPEETKGISFSTHQLPLKILADYIRHSINCEVMIIGIQPKTLSFGQPPTKSVEKSAKDIAKIIKGILE